MKILHVVAPAVAGGLERVVQALAIGHRRRGHAVSVAAILDEGDTEHPFLGPFRQAGVSLHVIPLAPRAYLAERRAMRALCHDLRPEIVHTHGYRPDVVDRGVAARLGAATVTTIHGASFIGGLKGSLYERIQRLSYRRFDAVVAVSRALVREGRRDGISERSLHLVPNAWGDLQQPLDREAARRRLDLPLDATVVGWVGRMIPVKGADLFIEAIGQLPEPRPVVAMIGHGLQATEIRRRVSAMGLDLQFRFYENVTEAGPLFGAFDVYVLSSRSEGLPVVLLEAMAAGTPIVATMVGGVTDALGDRDAYLVPPDDPSAMARAIRRSLTDQVDASARARSASERLRRDLGLEHWLDRYEEVYEHALRRRQPRVPRIGRPVGPRPALL